MDPVVLICDDNYAVHESLKSYLRKDGLECLSAYDGKEALKTINDRHVDLLILDIMLPELFGTEVCKQIRQKSNIPIIILSALGSETDRIYGLEIGADDYVIKPFSPKEVALRVQTILNRVKPSKKSNQFSFEELVINTDSYTATINGEKVAFSANEIKILVYFIENAEIVLSRERLLNAVWGYDYFGDVRAVDAQIKRIRKKLPTEGIHFSITSVYGVGFKLEKIK